MNDGESRSDRIDSSSEHSFDVVVSLSFCLKWLPISNIRMYLIVNSLIHWIDYTIHNRILCRSAYISWPSLVSWAHSLRWLCPFSIRSLREDRCWEGEHDCWFYQMQNIQFICVSLFVLFFENKSKPNRRQYSSRRLVTIVKLNSIRSHQNVFFLKHRPFFL